MPPRLFLSEVRAAAPNWTLVCRRRAAACALAAAVAGMVGQARLALAATDSFSNTSTVWLTPTNWSLGAIPTASDDVLIAGGSAAITLTASDQSIQFITFSGTSDRALGNSTTSATNSSLTLLGNGGANPLISVTSAANFTIRGANQVSIPGAGTFGLILGASGEVNITGS